MSIVRGRAAHPSLWLAGNLLKLRCSTSNPYSLRKHRNALEQGAGRMKRLIMRLQASGALPHPDYVLNHVVNRIPLVAARMRAYAALGVQFDDLASANICLGVEMWAGSNLSMGRGSTIGQRCYIDARAGIRVEPDVSISREVCVLTAAHEPDNP